MTMPDADYLREVFSYDPEEGILRWKKPTTRSVHIGDLAGNIFTTVDGNRYIKVKLNGKDYRAHRLIWCIVTGEWPSKQIDHRDLDGLNNRFKNLREASNTENGWNQKKKKTNKSGYKGVHLHKSNGKWIARIRVGGGRRLELGFFDSPEEAGAAYNKAALQYHGDFARAA